MTKYRGLVPAVLESDALMVIWDICNNMSLSSDVGLVVDEILNFSRESNMFSFIYVPRLVNRVAHGLAKLALSHLGEFVWVDDCLLCVESLVAGDSPFPL